MDELRSLDVWDDALALAQHGWRETTRADDAACEKDTVVPEEEDAREPPPFGVGREERRLQVRAYNLWAALLHGREVPCLADLAPEAGAQFQGHGMLLDLAATPDDPAILAIGVQLALVCGAGAAAARISQVPAGTLLATLVERHAQAAASRAPVSFDARLTDPDGRSLLCRGILLPFADVPGGAVTKIWGAVNWKEQVGEVETDALLREIGAAMAAPPRRREAALAAWADGPLGDDPSVPAPCDDMLDRDPPSPAPDAAAARARRLLREADAAEAHARTALHRALGAAYDLMLVGGGAHDGPGAPSSGAPLSGIRAQAEAALWQAFGRRQRAAHAAVLANARRTGLATGTLPGWLDAAPRGWHTVATAERRASGG